MRHGPFLLGISCTASVFTVGRVALSPSCVCWHSNMLWSVVENTLDTHVPGDGGWRGVVLC